MGTCERPSYDVLTGINKGICMDIFRNKSVKKTAMRYDLQTLYRQISDKLHLTALLEKLTVPQLVKKFPGSERKLSLQYCIYKNTRSQTKPVHVSFYIFL